MSGRHLGEGAVIAEGMPLIWLDSLFLSHLRQDTLSPLEGDKGGETVRVFYKPFLITNRSLRFIIEAIALSEGRVARHILRLFLPK